MTQDKLKGTICLLCDHIFDNLTSLIHDKTNISLWGIKGKSALTYYRIISELMSNLTPTKLPLQIVIGQSINAINCTPKCWD